MTERITERGISLTDFTNNLFYKIIHNEVHSYKIHEDDDFLVILDKYPANPGHCLILPKIPAQDIFDLDEGIATKLYPLAKRIAAAVKAATGCDGVNIVQNNGEAAGQCIFYFHLHIVPRFVGDGVVIKAASSQPFDDDDAITLQESITSVL